MLVLNHQSGIDLMAVMEIWPVLEKAAPIAKKELKYAGPFGLACWLCGAVFIDRFVQLLRKIYSELYHSEKAKQAMKT